MSLFLDRCLSHGHSASPIMIKGCEGPEMSVTGLFFLEGAASPLGLGADSFAGAVEPVNLPGQKTPQPVHFEVHVSRPVRYLQPG